MATAEGAATQLGALFVSVTGRATTVERQRDDVPVRLDDGAEQPVATYLDGVAKADGLDDAIDVPGTY